jgi:hypothetical protein
VLPPGTKIRFANHSCDPSLWHVGPYEIAARRDLQAGGEATIVYATHSGAGGFAMTCGCRSPACRGQVTADDRMLPELQRRYRGHWVPGLQQQIDRRQSSPNAGSLAEATKQARNRFVAHRLRLSLRLEGLKR